MEPVASVIVIHGYEGVIDDVWKPWLLRELAQRTAVGTVPAMPKPEHPSEVEWVRTIDHAVGAANQDAPIILVGHSLGGLAILKYLETSNRPPIHGAVILAGVIEPNRFDRERCSFATDWTAPKDWEQIKRQVKHLVGIYSRDDEAVPLIHGEILEEQGGAQLLVVEGYQHFSADTSDPKEVPELLQTIDTLIQLAK